ncbi:uncharacterized protein [Palaemon carinicauda]|uniref:uncharacterized protein n=1 Tax=Palaemon carinicauda TaxID=392227 RepID=UPI0035B6A204
MPLVHTFTRQSDTWSAPQRCHLSTVAEYNCPLQQVPGKINPVADVRGTTFTSQLWKSLANLLGITLNQTTAYNLAANGMVERFHLTLKAALMSRCNDSNWFTQFPCVLLRLRTTTKEALDILAAERVYGNPVGRPCQIFSFAIYSDDLQRIRHVMRKFTPCRQTYKPQAKCHIPTDLYSATYVLLHNDTSKPPLTPPYTGPFLEIRHNPKALLLYIRGKEDWQLASTCLPTPHC